jgi:hypothetical protein
MQSIGFITVIRLFTQENSMKKSQALAMFLLLAGGIATTCIEERPAAFICDASPDEMIQCLGNPMANDRKKGRARNVWDLQAFEGKIYLGGGSTTENAGPIHVWTYLPASSQFQKEYTVQEEAIELYRVFGGNLYIPAADPRHGDSNKFYQRTDGKWTSVSGGPDLAHVRDLYWHNGKLVGVGNSRQPEHTGAFVSLDGVLQAATAPTILTWSDNWFYALFEYQGILFAPSLRFNPIRDVASILTFNDALNWFEINEAYTTSDFLPLSDEYTLATMRLWLPVEYKGALVYPVKTYCVYKRCYHELYLRSYGLFVKASLNSAPVSVNFPSGVGEDVLVRDGVLYALANQRTVTDNYVIYVYRTTEPTEAWQEVLHFSCTNKARSFELLDNRFYFGLGHEADEPVGNSGALLSVYAPLPR